MSNLLRWIKFNLAYLSRPRWDSGIPAPELVRTLAGRPPGNAIDVGCGTGTNLLCLAQHDWKVTGLDFVPLAIKKAEEKLKDYPHTLLVADVAKLADLKLPGPYDLGLDIGCFHGLSGADRLAYVRGMEKWIKAQGLLMIYAFQPAVEADARGVTRQAMETYFKESFELTGYEQGEGWPSAWYYFKRNP